MSLLPSLWPKITFWLLLVFGARYIVSPLYHAFTQKIHFNFWLKVHFKVSNTKNENIWQYTFHSTITKLTILKEKIIQLQKHLHVPFSQGYTTCNFFTKPYNLRFCNILKYSRKIHTDVWLINNLFQIVLQIWHSKYAFFSRFLTTQTKYLKESICLPQYLLQILSKFYQLRFIKTTTTFNWKK